MSNFHKVAIVLLITIAIGAFKFVSVADNKMEQDSKQTQSVFPRDSGEFLVACAQVLSGVVMENEAHNIKCMKEEKDITNDVELKLYRLSQDYGTGAVLDKLLPDANTTADAGVTNSGEPTSPFDSYEPMPNVIESSVKYDSGTTSFTNPWEYATFTDKDGHKNTLLYNYCDIVGAQIDGVKKAGISWKEVYSAFANYGPRMSGLPVVSGEKVDTKYEDSNYSGFAFRKASHEACFVTFVKQSMDCMNHALNTCHVTFEINDSIAESFGASMKSVLDSAKYQYDADKAIRLNSEDIVDAIHEFDYNGGKTR